jgi:hypothetical protein
MKLIQPRCRRQFAAEDMAFVVSVLAGTLTESECLVKLLADEDSRDEILDNEAIFRALLEKRGCLRVSSRFYFYVLVRQVFRRFNLEDRVLADYVAEVLAEFAQAERSRCVVAGEAAALEYFFELLSALERADDLTRFHLRLHIGNYSLFLAGVFPERIRSRAETRGFPDLRYYEGLGRSNYRAASDHRLAQRYELAGVLTTLADRFGQTRAALNDLSDRLLSLGDGADGAGGLLHGLRN